MPSLRTIFLGALLIALFVAPRIHSLGQPLLEVQTGRQIDTATMARNFFRNGFALIYPQLDSQGSKPGYLDSEFQVYPFLVAVLYKLFGLNTDWGRWVSIVCGVLTMLYIGLAALRLAGRDGAMLACLVLATSPVSRLYHQTFQPDALWVLCVTAAWFHFWRWTEGRRPLTGERLQSPDLPSPWHFAMTMTAFLLAVLIKLPAFYLMLAFTWFLYEAKKRDEEGYLSQARWMVTVATLAVVVWYLHAKTLGREGLSWGVLNHLNLRETVAFWMKPEWWIELLRAGASRVISPLFLPFLLLGGWAAAKRQEYYGVWCWLGGTAAFYLASAWSLYRHEYYHLGTVPAAALIVAASTKTPLWRWLRSLVERYDMEEAGLWASVILLCGVLSLDRPARNDFPKGQEAFWAEWNEMHYKLGEALAHGGYPPGLLLTPSNISLYYGDRKGWVPPRWDRLEVKQLEAMKAEGLRFVILAPAPEGMWRKAFTLPEKSGDWLRSQGKETFERKGFRLLTLVDPA